MRMSKCINFLFLYLKPECTLMIKKGYIFDLSRQIIEVLKKKVVHIGESRYVFSKFEKSDISFTTKGKEKDNGFTLLI